MATYQIVIPMRIFPVGDPSFQEGWNFGGTITLGIEADDVEDLSEKIAATMLPTGATLVIATET